MRRTRITASEVACCLTRTEEICKNYIDLYKIKNFKYNNKCLSAYDTFNDYIIKKCETKQTFIDNIYTLHGKKYEEIATRLYRKLYNTQVIPFGLLPHNTINYLGASPDGITPDGIMLEIKCPYSRKINGIPPIHYYAQMQLQLEVADLDYCDYLELEIKEVDLIDFMNPLLENVGILFNYFNKQDNDETKYIYPPDNLNTKQEFLDWANQPTISITKPITECIIADPDDLILIYYNITKWNIIRVPRSKEWFDNVKKILSDTYKIIHKYQNDKLAFEEFKENIYPKPAIQKCLI